MRLSMRFLLRAIPVAAALVATGVGMTAAVAAPPAGAGKGPKPTTTTTITSTAVTLRITEFERISDRGGRGALASLPAPRRDHSCDVVVPLGSGGAQVLAAAVGSGCLQSYELALDRDLRYVRCVDGTCNTSVGWRYNVSDWMWGAGVEWAIFNGNQRVWYLHEFSASERAALTLAYGPTAGACALVITGSAFQCVGATIG